MTTNDKYLKLEDIDYSSLSSWRAFYAQVIKDYLKNITLKKILFFALVVIVILYVILIGNTIQLISVFLVASFYLIILNPQSKKREDENWHSFASNNQWGLEIAVKSDIPPSLKGFRNTDTISMTIDADINGCSQRILCCYTNLPYLIICVELPAAFPHIIPVSENPGL